MLVDVHAHLDRYEDKLETALEQIRQNDIFTISNSLDLPSYERNLDIARSCDLVLPTFGIHPWNASEYVDCLDDLKDAIAGSPMIGEIGLDYFFIDDASRYPAQRRVFEFFLNAAREQDKVVILHTKGAEKDVFELLAKHQVSRAIIHWYSGPLDVLEKLVDYGAYHTVGPELLHSEHIREIASRIPVDQLLTETDNPGGPRSFLGEMGMPVLVQDVVRRLAELYDCSRNDIVQRVYQNLLDVVGGDQWLERVYEQLLQRQSGDTQ